MKLDPNKQSKNVEDRSRDTSATAFKSNPFKNPAIQRVIGQRNEEYQEYGNKVIKKTMADKGNPFRSMLKGMGSNQLTNRQKRANRIPIPTPKPEN